MNKISIIIATYNGRKFLEVSIPSILKSTYRDFELIICDDCSTDSSLEYIREIQRTDSRLVLLQNLSNLGAAATRNHAVSRATTNILIFLDNDTEVDQDWLDPLITPLLNEGSVGGVQSTLIDFLNRDSIQLIGTHLIPHTFWGIPLYAGKKVDERPLINTNIIALSAAMSVRKDLYEKLGGFDELLGVYTEDIEFSFRIWLSGYEIISAPQSKVYHWTKKVADRKGMFATKEKIYFHLAKNSLRSILKNYEWQNVIYYLPVAIAILIIRALLLLRSRDISAIKGTTKGLIWTIANMSNTLQERNNIQAKIRKTTDKAIMDKVFTKKSLLSIYKEYFS